MPDSISTTLALKWAAVTVAAILNGGIVLTALVLFGLIAFCGLIAAIVAWSKVRQGRPARESTALEIPREPGKGEDPHTMKISALVLAGTLLAAAIHITAGRGAGTAVADIILCGLAAIAVARGSLDRARWDIAPPARRRLRGLRGA